MYRMSRLREVYCALLNELYELSRALTEHGLLRPTTHPNVRTIGKSPCLLIELDKVGIPRESRLLSAEETAKLWKHSKGNHNNFPAIRVQEPLLDISESKKIQDKLWKKAKLTEKLSLLAELDFTATNPKCTDVKITDWSLREFGVVSESNNIELSALRQLISVFPHEEQSLNFTRRLTDFFCKKIRFCDSEAELNFIKTLLVGQWDDKKQKYIASCMTYYDVYDADDFPHLVISSATKQTLIKLLNEEDHSNKDDEDSIISPLSGVRQGSMGDKYPNPNIPLLGLTYLYSKKADIPCLTRYKRSGVTAYRIGKMEVSEINDAIAFLTAKERRNKTWRAMSSNNQEKPNLLLAYLTDDPQNMAYLAQILADPTSYDSEEERIDEMASMFGALCEQVLGSMEDVLRKNPVTKINLIIFETLDPGRKQVVYERSLTAEQFRENLLVWSEAAKNHPPIEIRLRRKKEMIRYGPLCPGPDEILHLLKLYYIRSGSAKLTKQSSVSLHDVYELYMPRNEVPRDFVNEFLVKALFRTFELLSDLGYQLMLNYTLAPIRESETVARNARLAIGLISILLWHLGIRKENYMSKAPFNVGQFLRLADLLHKQYCIYVRNNGDRTKALPLQLMGNEMLPIAAENPVEALERLLERMRIYLAWADTTTGDGAGLAKWIWARFNEISDKISGDDLPEKFTPAEQAQVLLGYLASIPYEKSERKNEQKNGQGEEFHP